MASTMNASNDSMTDGQIEDAVNKFRDALRKKRGEFPSTAAQIALGTDNLGMRLLAPFRELVEMNSDLIVRRVLVPARSFQTALDATRRKQYTTRAVVDGVPATVEGVEREVIFAKPPASWYKDDIISCKKVAEFLDTMGLEPDPHGAAAVNEADPAFADEHPNATQWQNADGNYCYAAFDRWDDERSVDVDRYDGGWSDYWSFAGRRKST